MVKRMSDVCASRLLARTRRGPREPPSCAIRLVKNTLVPYGWSCAIRHFSPIVKKSLKTFPVKNNEKYSLLVTKKRKKSLPD